MKSFIRLQLASVLGSILDFSSTWIWVNWFHAGYIEATVAGNILGGLCLFILCRSWVFKKNNSEIPFQAAKFILVFAGSILLSAAGVYLLTHDFGVQYMISKVICSVLLGVSYNYILQAKYVFV
jgi:putative flippase GtrA